MDLLTSVEMDNDPVQVLKKMRHGSKRELRAKRLWARFTDLAYRRLRIKVLRPKNFDRSEIKEETVVYSKKRFVQLTVKALEDDIPRNNILSVLGFMEQIIKDWKNNSDVPVLSINNVGVFYFPLTQAFDRKLITLGRLYKSTRNLNRLVKDGTVSKEQSKTQILYRKMDFFKSVSMFYRLLRYISINKVDKLAFTSWYNRYSPCGADVELKNLRENGLDPAEFRAFVHFWWQDKLFIGLGLDKQQEKKLLDIANSKTKYKN